MIHDKNNIRIEEVGDVNSEYNYLEIFYLDNLNPFMEVSITADKDLAFLLYPFEYKVQLTIEEWEYILSKSKVFFVEALKNEEDFHHIPPL